MSTTQSLLHSSALFLLLLATPTAATELCNPEDEKALLQIKKTFPDSTSQWLWLPNTNCCTHWYGVGCNLNHRVHSIFKSLPFTTSLPSALGDLPYLTFLQIRKLPNLTGPIPRSLSKLTHLQYLHLDYNSLTGPVPDFFNRLNNLASIDLSYNNLSGSIPPSLGFSSSLTFLSLRSNHLTGSIPNTLGSSFPYSTYTYVDLSHNHLSGPIPAYLGSANITNLDLSRNNLTGDASFLFSESSLTNLDLSRNLLSFDLSKVEVPTGLVVLNLDHNRIYGSLPHSLADNKFLVYFNVSYNRLCGRIPKGGHFGYVNANLDEYSFFHNKCLCGSPLPPCA